MVTWLPRNHSLSEARDAQTLVELELHLIVDSYGPTNIHR